MLRHLRWIWATLVVVACLDSFAPAGATEFSPPAVYRTWWAEIAACAGLSGDFAAIDWYQVVGTSYSCPAYEGSCSGWWQPPHTIYLAAAWVNDRQLVEHEMLHDLLQRGDHPPVFQACGVSLSAVHAAPPLDVARAP
ncbi:MAG TPA: hypothetical protein VEU55_00540 [Gemmatimonadales bacterium]|nr:hypothetical protein [Gemmatimonadales bacterium]